MKYAKPLTTTLTDGTYTKTIYKEFTSIANVASDGYNNYDSSATYNTGDYVIVPALQTIYKCAADNTSGVYPPDDTTKWVEWSKTNAYKMLGNDEDIGDKTTGADIVATFDFAGCDVVGILGCSFDSLTIEQKDNNGNILVSKTLSGSDIGCTDFAGYFYNDAGVIDKVIFTETQWATSTITLTFSGHTEIETVVVGKTKDLGVLLFGADLTINDNSKIKIDDFTGFRQVLRYGHTIELKGNVVYQNTEFNLSVQKILDIVGKNVLFIPTDLDKYGEMNNIAYIESFSAPINNPQITSSPITLIGVK